MTQTFHFIACTNNPVKMDECRHYIRRLFVPEGWTVEITEIMDASSMASGYNQAIHMCPGDTVRTRNVPVRIYLHQDVFILNRYFLHNLLKLFRSYPKTGLVGMAGTPSLHPSGVMWSGSYIGNIYEPTDAPYEEELLPEMPHVTEVVSVDGFLMATCVDVPWREDLFDGFDYYDISQCMEFMDAGFHLIVPEQAHAWCVHDDGKVLALYSYNHYRKRFLDYYKAHNRFHMLQAE